MGWDWAAAGPDGQLEVLRYSGPANVAMERVLGKDTVDVYAEAGFDGALAGASVPLSVDFEEACLAWCDVAGELYDGEALEGDWIQIACLIVRHIAFCRRASEAGCETLSLG